MFDEAGYLSNRQPIRENTICKTDDKQKLNRENKKMNNHKNKSWNCKCKFIYKRLNKQ